MCVYKITENVKIYSIKGIPAGFTSAIFEAIMFYIFDLFDKKALGYQFTAIGERLFHLGSLDGEITGLLMHFLVGSIVGFFAALISYYIKLRPKNYRQSILIGILAGFLILLLFSLPVNIFMLHLYVYENYDLISTDFYYSMHIFYGLLWCLFLYIFLGS
ncbi:hypothetical protein [Picrophilus oshimae]|nr:hypothetical protein [Picrophilus oshimae]SMD31292.1 hypothetical protein SAMN02745355_1220 [Picrophilus oshimae DSM 9789]